MTLSRPFGTLGDYAQSRARPIKRWIAMLADAALCIAATWLACLLRLGALPDRAEPIAIASLASIALALPLFRLLGLYHEIFSQSGVRAIVAIGRACLIYTLAFAALVGTGGLDGVPRTMALIQPLLLFVAIAGSRLLVRYWLTGIDSVGMPARRRVLILGAGSVGRQIAAAIAQSGDMRVVGYLDDTPALIGSVLDGCRIHAARDIAPIALRLSADELLLAQPHLPSARRSALIAEARAAGLRVRTLPGLADLAPGRIAVAQIRDIEIEDLLGRDLVAPDLALMRGGIEQRVVMVTGAGGSIGSELCRQLLMLEPALLLLVELSEFALYEVHRQLAARAAAELRDIRIVPLIGSVCDEARMDEIVATWRPDCIYHAAAYKHVPLIQHNPAEGVRTNLFGTLTLASVAARRKVPAFVLVSTDKAVRPTSVMGATKRAAEMVLQALDRASPATCFSMVRFGNVLGTSGSVVPLFRQQIREGGPVTVTDLRMTRYFMTVSEAAELVLQAGAMARGGEVFMLDMGEPVRIADLARNMIALAGLEPMTAENPAGAIEIVEIGLRPGEKLYEELLISANPSPTAHPRILTADEAFLPLPLLRAKLDHIATLLGTGHCEALLGALHDLVPEFRNQGGNVDWVHLERTAPVESMTQTA